MKVLQNFKPEHRFLRLNVYQFPLGDCGGVTDGIGKEDVFIPCETGPTKFEDIDRKDLIFLENQRSAEYWALVPNIQPENVAGPMAGGNLAYTSDSRCKRIYHIHDRFESWAMYNSMD